MLKELEQIGTAEELRDYECKVAAFYERHLMLVIRIHHPQIASSSWHLTFIAVYYFQGPIFWTGANFANASNEVSQRAWKRVYPEQTDERIEQITRIFHTCTVDIAPEPIVMAYGGVSAEKVEFPFPKS